MTKEELSQLRKLKNEIRLLKEQKAEIRTRMSMMKTPTSVLASGKCEPYQQHNVTIQGVALGETEIFTEQDEKLQKINLDIADRERCVTEEYDRLNAFISGVKDSELRQILTLYYILGKTWPQVAFRVGCRDEGTPRKKVDKFLSDSGFSGS
jgi:hypothetical protein